MIERVVVKLGTGILTLESGGVHRDRIASICASIDTARKAGVSVCVVSSGAVGLGMKELGYRKRPTDLPTIQSCAAVGQSILIQVWKDCLEPYGYKAAQVLLTREDLRGRRRHVAVKDTLERLFSLGIVPIVNENDCVSTMEIRFGDNDVLSALVASLMKAQFLLILSSIPGLMNLKTGEVIHKIEKITPEIEGMAMGTTSQTSVGGMVTKIEAARIANRSRCAVMIGDGKDTRILERLQDQPPTGTLFLPAKGTMSSRKRWIAFFDRPVGALVVDEGAKTALIDKGRSLLPKGLREISGTFQKSEIVEICLSDGVPFARGRTKYSSKDLLHILGKSSDEVRELLPDHKRAEVVHRDELVILEQ